MKKATILIFLLSACAYRVEKIPEAPVEALSGNLGFEEINSLILVPKCGRCHSNHFVGDYPATLGLVAEIAQRVQSNDPAEKMPPPGNDDLTAAEKRALLLWIGRGAPQNASAPQGAPES